MIAGCATMAPLFLLPRALPSSPTSIFRSQTSGEHVSPVAPTHTSSALAGMTSFMIAGAALVAAGAVSGRTSRHAAAGTGSKVKKQDSQPPAPAKPRPPPPPPFDPSKQVGAIPPLGYFDPLGFSKEGDKQGFRDLREAELKHGRVAMVASLGLVVQHFVHPDVMVIPVKVNTAPYGMGAWTVFWGPVGFFALTGLAFFTFAMETMVWLPNRREPGDYGDPLGLNIYTEDMRNRELSNGRFAMFAVVGILVAEVVTGKDAVQQLGLGL
mmetsp:Transcript_16644/g.34742  ORF Transcript_16644/g.34742 Transcript_16644/m.34742 type:complete len:268 (+) Transcript_16644:2-805(+)